MSIVTGETAIGLSRCDESRPGDDEARKWRLIAINHGIVDQAGVDDLDNCRPEFRVVGDGGQYETAELQEAQEDFHRLDRDGSGALNSRELQVALREMGFDLDIGWAQHGPGMGLDLDQGGGST